MVRSLRRRLVPVLRGRAWRRLEGEIRVFEHKLSARLEAAHTSKDTSHLREVLQSAKEALRAGDIDEGWRCLQSAQRLLLSLSSGAELRAEAASMRAEADKLAGWRKGAVEALLQEEPSVEDLVKAAEIRDEHYSNQAYKDGIQRSSMSFLAGALASAVLLLFATVFWGDVVGSIGSYTAHAGSVGLLFGLAVVGLLDSSVSAITRAARSQGPARIPEMVASFHITFLRLTMGPVSAIVVYFLIQSNLYDSVFNLPRPNGFGLLVIAFAAGFSERLVLRVVELIAGGSS
jgi:hypothetical protein